MQSFIFSIITTEFSVTVYSPSEIILIYWFDALDTIVIILVCSAVTF